MDNELREKLIKAKSQEEVTEILKAEGQDTSDAGSGGKFWLGEDAPDGHELDCIFTWYDGWDSFDAVHTSTYCPGTKGKKHDFAIITKTEEGLFGNYQLSYDVCTRCDYVRTKISA